MQIHAYCLCSPYCKLFKLSHAEEIALLIFRAKIFSPLVVCLYLMWSFFWWLFSDFSSPNYWFYAQMKFWHKYRHMLCWFFGILNNRSSYVAVEILHLSTQYCFEAIITSSHGWKLPQPWLFAHWQSNHMQVLEPFSCKLFFLQAVSMIWPSLFPGN